MRPALETWRRATASRPTWASSDGLDLSGTEHVRLECTGGATTCTDWSAEPSLGASGETLVCRLFEYSTKGRFNPVKIADFNMPFAFLAALQ